MRSIADYCKRIRIRNVKELAALVRDRRENLGLSQEELARRVGVSRLWIGLLEKGKSTSRVGLVLRTLDVLGVVLEVGKKPLPLPGSISLDEVLKSRTGKGAA